MKPRRTAAIVPCALAAALLTALTGTFRTLRPLARLADQRDPIILLEHPSGGVGELLGALGRADAALLTRLCAWWVPAVALLLYLWRRRAPLRARGAAIAFVVVAAALIAWQALVDRRVAMRTLCWAANSGVYARPTRERALARGRALIGSPLGRVAEALGAHARPRCEQAGTVLGIPE